MKHINTAVNPVIFETEPTCGAAFLAVAEGGRAHRPQAKALGPLLACCVTCLVRVPQLLTVITELCAAAVPAACNLWTAGTSKRYDCVSVKGEKKWRAQLKIKENRH